MLILIKKINDLIGTGASNENVSVSSQSVENVASTSTSSFQMPTSTQTQSTSTSQIPPDISPIGADCKTPLKLSNFPKNSDKRCFQKQWIDKYEWIEYSPNRDAVFCFIC